ncbi:hypothetical protein DRO42_08140 [Candidatus Bathyarchaeota archaeon]|nr:MAG: hypothetical protein DRO42_08140 [Candidatus Bathyarchaeota archaeon]
MPLFGRKKGAEYSYEGKYLGGHSAFPKEMKVHINLMPNYLEIQEFPAFIPYENIINVQSMSQEKLSAMRLLLVGIFAFAWKKKKQFMVLTYKDDAGIEQNPVFDMKKIEEVQPAIYRKMIAARQK